MLRTGIELPPESIVRSTDEWNRWCRAAFRSISRRSLRPDFNQEGEAGSLQAIQFFNQPVGFDPLHDELPQILWETGGSRELDRVRIRCEQAGEMFYRIRDELAQLRRIRRLKFDWDGWACRHAHLSWADDNRSDPATLFQDDVDDYPAVIYRAHRRLSGRMGAVLEHVAREHYPEVVAATRAALLFDGWRALPDSALLRLLALYEACDAYITLHSACRAMSECGEALDLGRLDCSLSALANAQSWREGAAWIDSQQQKETARNASRVQDEKSATSRQMQEIRGIRGAVGSKAIRQLATKLRSERRKASSRQLFDIAIGRVEAATEDDGGFTVRVDDVDYLITISYDTPDDKKLLSTDAATGKQDGVPVGWNGWKNFAELKKTFRVTT